MPNVSSCSLNQEITSPSAILGKQFYKVQDGDTCAGIVDKYHTFTLQNLYVSLYYSSCMRRLLS